MIGTLVGSIMGKLYLEEALAFTSGGFLYFAINGLMSELKQVQKWG
jgi:zinc transporter ZupT